MTFFPAQLKSQTFWRLLSNKLSSPMLKLMKIYYDFFFFFTEKLFVKQKSHFRRGM